jgi:anthranilate phosphoribosyltransferase
VSLLDAIRCASAREDVPSDVLEAAFATIMEGEASEVQIAALFVALRTKGESAAEIVAAARALRAKASTAALPVPDAVDTCGTGGDGAETFNISTVSAFVVAGAGATVVKHGNRAASSRCGSYDVLEALGVVPDLPVPVAAAMAGEIGIGFFFARRAHPAMRHVAGVRQELGIRSIMNCLGPLLNPVGVKRQLVGVYDPGLVEVIARALGELGSERALVVHGHDGLDELSTTGPSHAVFLDAGNVEARTVDPEALGLTLARAPELRGGEAAENAAIARRVLGGAPGPTREIVLLNAAGALWAAGRAADLADGLILAAESIDSGAAESRLEALVRSSREAAPK